MPAAPCSCSDPIVKLRVILDENACKEKLLRSSEQEVQTLRQELGNLQRVHENSMREMRRLTDDLTNAAQESRCARSELEQARQEVENLKRQLQDYVAEVQRVEELLQQKEGERGDLLDHFRSLSAEARSLESNNQSLNHEAEDTKHRLDQAEMRILDLEMVVETRNNLVCGYENQIAELSAHVASLEGRLQAETDQKCRLEADISAVRDLCVKLDNQKDNLIEATAESNLMKAQLENELARVQDELDAVHDDLAKDRGTVEALEQCLAASRQETADGRAANQELQAEIAALLRRMDDLQGRLDCETSEVRRYQEQAADYTQQVSELRREVTNEKFEKARITEDSRRSCEPGCSCLRTGVNRYAGASTPDPASLSRPRRPVGSASACPPPGQPQSVGHSRSVGQPRHVGHVPPVNAVRRPAEYQASKSYGIPPDDSRRDARPTGSCRKTCQGIKDSHPMAESYRSASAKTQGLPSFQKVNRIHSLSSVSSSESDESLFKNKNITKRAVYVECPAANVPSHEQKVQDPATNVSPKGSKQEEPSAVHNIGDPSRSKLPKSSKCRNPNRELHDASNDLHRQNVTLNQVPDASLVGNVGVDQDGPTQRRKRKSCGCKAKKRLEKSDAEKIELLGILDMENVGGINIVHQKVKRESDGTHNELQGTIVDHLEAQRELSKTNSEHLVASKEHHGTTKEHHETTKEHHRTTGCGGRKKRKGASREHLGTSKEQVGTSRECLETRKDLGSSREHHGTSREHHGTSREHHGTSREHHGTSIMRFGGSKERRGSRREHHGTSKEHHGTSKEHHIMRFGGSKERKEARREHHGTSKEHLGSSREHHGTSIMRFGGSKERRGSRREPRETGRELHDRSMSSEQHQSAPNRNRTRNESDSDTRHKRFALHSASRDKSSNNSKESIYRAKRTSRSLEDYFQNEHSSGNEKISSTVVPASSVDDTSSSHAASVNDTSSSHVSSVNDTSSSHASSVNDAASGASFQSASSVNNQEAQSHKSSSEVVLTHKHNTPSNIN